LPVIACEQAVELGKLVGHILWRSEKSLGQHREEFHRVLGSIRVDERQIRFWERRHHSKLSGARHHATIERALPDHGVILFAEPMPGCEAGKTLSRTEKRQYFIRLNDLKVFYELLYQLISLKKNFTKN
jgi:hypothetical protein